MFSTLAFVALASADITKLATFDKAAGTTFKWDVQNDPVMGGASTSTFELKDNLGIFNGTNRDVPSLNAPGFAKIATSILGFRPFADVSAYINGTMQLRVKSSIPTYKGFKLDFGAEGVPTHAGGHELEGSFKANFLLEDTTDFQIVHIPMEKFSWDWSDFTGECSTKDPTGSQHHCCSTAEPQYCPTPKFLSKINTMQLWAEGVAGDFHLEIDYIAAGSA